MYECHFFLPLSPLFSSFFQSLLTNRYVCMYNTKVGCETREILIYTKFMSIPSSVFFINFLFSITKCMFSIEQKKNPHCMDVNGKDYSMVRRNRLIVVTQKSFVMIFFLHSKDFLSAIVEGLFSYF